MQLSTTVRNARLDAIETAVGAAPLLLYFSGAKPANCAAADPSGVLATLTLPADWLAAASAGVKARTGSWAVTASAAGSIASFRIKNAAGTVCHLQGTVTATGGGGDLTIDDVAVEIDQVINVTTFALTDGNG